jgi:uncharacterized tellurite resistance protein B-like protein
MGLFDMFKGDSGLEMTPHLAFATSLLYMIAADGEISNEEVGQLLSVLGGEESGGTIGVGANNRQLLENAQRYIRGHSMSEFLAEATPLLSDAQKMCVLVNLADSLLSDGSAAPEEQKMFGQVMQGFGISEERFQPFFEVILLKNDRTVFIKQDHPNNDPGYVVKLSK